MADEFKNRKDIEILYDLVYNRTTGSPVTQKSEFDAFKNTVMNDYASKDYVSTVTEPLVNSLDGYVESANETIASIEEDISDIQDSISSLEDDVSDIDSSITSINSSLTSLQNDITAINNKINANWVKIAEATSQAFNVTTTVWYRNRTVRVTIVGANQITVSGTIYFATMGDNNYKPPLRVKGIDSGVEYGVNDRGEIYASGTGQMTHPFWMLEYQVDI